MRGQPSQTAEAVCWMRASEQRRKPSERILDDPYAKLFLGPMLRAARSSCPRMLSKNSGTWSALTQIRFVSNDGAAVPRSRNSCC